MKLNDVTSKFLYFTKTDNVNNIILLINSLFLFILFLSKLNLVFVQSCQKECVGLIISSTLLELSPVFQKVHLLVLDFESPLVIYQASLGH